MVSDLSNDNDHDRIQREAQQAAEMIIGKDKIRDAIESGDNMVEVRMPREMLPLLKLAALIAQAKS